MNATSIDIKDVLVAAGIGTFGGNIFIGSQPDTPDQCIVLYDTGGFPPESGYKYDRPTIQISIRGEVGGYADAYAKAQLIKDTLHNWKSESWNVLTRYIGVWAMSDAMFLGQDDKHRPEFSVNFLIHRTT